jgi:hypothetical protein
MRRRTTRISRASRGTGSRIAELVANVAAGLDQSISGADSPSRARCRCRSPRAGNSSCQGSESAVPVVRGMVWAAARASGATTACSGRVPGVARVRSDRRGRSRAPRARRSRVGGLGQMPPSSSVTTILQNLVSSSSVSTILQTPASRTARSRPRPRCRRVDSDLGEPVACASSARRAAKPRR